MSDTDKLFVVAPRAAMVDQVPPDWQNRITETPGVAVVGRTPGQLQIRAPEDAMQNIKDKVGHLLYIEEAAPRGFAE